jgi:para-aminobenzoate synthetase
MKILLVDNGTHYKKKLTDFLGRSGSVTSISYEDLTIEDADGYDLIVLSGAYKTYDVKNHAASVYATEQEIIRKAKVPVVGICLGAQLIAYMHGAKLSNVPGGKVKGLKRVYNVRQTPFDFFPYYGGRVWSSQKWRITELPEDLEAWCASSEGVEVFRHRSKPYYGLQFHPEYHSVDNDGGRIFNKILELEFGKKHK